MKIFLPRCILLCVPERHALWLVHTADTDKTSQLCLVRLGGVNEPLHPVIYGSFYISSFSTKFTCMIFILSH